MIETRQHLVKLRRAQSHLENLNMEVEKWLRDSFRTITHEKHPDRPGYFSAYITPEPIPVYSFAVLVGDILHNLRGTLDHLVYALAEKHSGIPLSDDVAQKSEFPIYGDAEGYGVAEIERRRADGFRQKIGAIHPGAQALIKKLQPYHRGNRYIYDPLWVLNELSNIDKHRLLLASALKIVTVMFRPQKCINFTPGEVDAIYGVIEGKTKIVTYSGWPTDPSKEMHVQVQPVIDIIFTCSGPLNGVGMQLAVNQSIMAVAEIVGRFDAFF